MPSSPDRDAEALAWVHRGWDHLKLQRPLAAWASWQRALRLKPGDPAATQALDLLASADDLPAAARATYRFRPPAGADRRARWDAHFRDRDLAELDAAAGAFAALADADPTDAAASFNLALALAWLGRNVEAIAALDRFTTLEAADDFEAAVAAWTLAEVLRQGGGAEELADDLDHVVTVPWGDEDGDPTSLDEPGRILPRQAPGDEGGPSSPFAGIRVFEWLDRPMPPPTPSLSADDLPRVRATVLQSPGQLRVSTPEDAYVEPVLPADRARPVRRESTPLPLRLADAAVWTFRLPAGLDDDARDRLTREAIESYYEDRWIHRRRHGLAEGTPLDAGRRGAEGDVVARARLAAVIRLREQLASRPRVAPLYGGYPFDRLRRRVGLDPIDPSSVDPSDYACMGLAELRRLDPSTLDEPSAREVARSALGLHDEDLARRTLAATVDRDASALIRDLPPPWPFPLLLPIGELDGMIALTERALAIDSESNGGRDRILYETILESIRPLRELRDSAGWDGRLPPIVASLLSCRTKQSFALLVADDHPELPIEAPR